MQVGIGPPSTPKSNKRGERKKSLGDKIVWPLVVLVIGFFLVAILERPRDAFLRLIGLKSNPKSQALVEAPKSEVVQKPAEPEGSRPSLVPNLTPYEVCQAIDSAPFLQQEEVAKNYIGMPIDCVGELGAVSRQGQRQGFVRVMITYIPSTERLREMVHIHFVVYEPDYPGLALLKGGTKVHVSGIIESVLPPSMNLKDAKLISFESK
ncbi:MAG: hypothetical protein E4G99_09055 [Anaerolineales bacterium]|nr:MAG: hypothetical protein E4G99_09055 [Anaerolineales bacterium]